MQKNYTLLKTDNFIGNARETNIHVFNFFAIL